MFEGIYAALLTPFDQNGELVEQQLRDHIEWLVGKQIDGLYICGNSGQGLYMSVEERKRVAAIVKDQVAGRSETIAHVAALNTRDAKELVDHANEIGLDAVSSLAPVYWPFRDEEIVDYYRDIMRDSDLPCFMYVKSGAGTPELSVKTVLEIADIRGMVGMKYTSPNFYRMQQIVHELNGRWIVLSGPDELFLPALTMGVAGSIGTTQNIFPELFQEILRCFREGDLDRAMAVQEMVTDIVALYQPYNSCVTAHTMLQARGLPRSYCRAPFTKAVPEEHAERILKALKGITGQDSVLPCVGG